MSVMLSPTEMAYRAVQLWSMKNYHYYLKQELRSHTSAARLRAIRWHPEQPLQLYLVGDGELLFS